ncbi:MAG: malonyl-CoA synthase [Herminiimonas sp.]|nr:malonyl-CoA synthase [Herminiimonas sp.]
MNLYHALYADRDPAGVALGVPGAATYTTAVLVDQIGRYAAALHALGVRQGDRVSFKLEKAPEIIFLAHACIQLGAILHPLNTAYTDQEIAYLLGDAEPALFVCDPEEKDRFENTAAQANSRLETLSAGGGGTLGALASQQQRRQEIADLDADATAAILYTSGTTGKPKGAQITHRNLAESARALASVWRLGRSDALLHALPVYHAHGLLTAINTMLAAGGSILFLPRFDAGEVIVALPAATLIMGVPTHYARLLREPGFAEALRPTFRLAISGSAPLPLELAAQFVQRTGRHIIERYGSTEAAIVTAVPDSAGDRTGWVGWPLPGVEVRVAAPDGTRAQRSATGALETRGHNVFSGYWKRPEADREAFTPDGWFVTGDVAEIDGTGCVRLLDRSKDLIISGGLNVYPREVESVLDTLSGIAQSAVFGAPHPDFGEAVAAVVELETGAGFDEAAAIAAAKTRLAAYKVPKRILAVNEIPRNRMGKVLKAELRANYRSLFVPVKT